MRVAVSGSTGLVGSALVAVLSAAGHEVVPLVRTAPSPGEKAVRWDPGKGEIDAAGLEGLDAVVHVAGENIA
ncbi:MAG TPA: NAD-dependent epimerase/dehydratase family protein, partial [Patescibacteria group bacterium]|nr:NAD-dependent epimerase/dehydratase family protein [Patescibacteria group bacterium]